MPTGTAIVDFGAFPGSGYATVVITGQAAILSTSLVEAWILPAATTDHTHDEHLVDPPRVIAGTIVVATGFTIHGFNTDAVTQLNPVNPDDPNSYPRIPLPWGKWNVAWVWQ